MKQSYVDITSLIPQSPQWWDEQGVPRYVPFHPLRLANIYATQAALVHINCQHCGRSFDVAFSWSRSVWGKNADGSPWVREQPDLTREDVAVLHYGDPPNVGCCAGGATMNSEPRQVLEFWRHSRRPFHWERVPELEIPLTPAWEVS